MQNSLLESRASAGDVAAQIALARELRALGDLETAERWLRQAAAGGTTEAVAELGLQLYLAPPPSSPEISAEGTRLLTQAAYAGHASSAHMAALIAIHDSQTPDPWRPGLELAARAAADGYRLAQLALAFLSFNSQLMRSPDMGRLGLATWQQLAGQILGAPLLTELPALRTLCQAPQIQVAEGFLPPGLCDWIIGRAGPGLRKSGGGYLPQAGGANIRTNSEVEYGFHQLDLVHAVVRHRIARLTGLPRSGLEPVSVFRYAVGEQFTPHVDYLDPAVPALAAEIARTGQCVATVLIYLSDDFDGGETEFAELGLKFKGRKGDALVFRNVDGNGVVDPRTRHAGLPPTRGEKWLLTQFIRDTKRANRIPGA
jgi:prolyl 4-hydroxylase